MPQTEATGPEWEPGATGRPLYEAVREWVGEALAGGGCPVPAQKRAALLVTGLVAGERATESHLASTLAGLGITPAKEESIVRRLQRIWADARLDPAHLLPAIWRTWLPRLLAPAVAAHVANERSGAGHHRRFRPLRLVVDESSTADRVHLLLIGLAYQGLVLPLGVRCWEQNAPLPAGEYWAHLGGLLWEVQALLPPELRDHVLVLADRGYAGPRLLDLLGALGWAYVIRSQGQTRVRLPDGTVCPLRDLVARPGAVWLGGAGDPRAPADAPVAVFKGAGWRTCQVVAVWAVGQPAPWLLLTDLPASAARARDYARRWAIERTFLAWKSHGWDLEACGLRDPARLGRLVSALALATWWRVAVALPVCQAHLTALAARAARRSPRPLPPVQLALWEVAPPPRRPARPWAAKFSLLTWGAKVCRATPCRSQTPALCWSFPAWDDPLWSLTCSLAYDPAA
jgi:hypothetical protein